MGHGSREGLSGEGRVAENSNPAQGIVPMPHGIMDRKNETESRDTSKKALVSIKSGCICGLGGWRGRQRIQELLTA